jgi:DNA repair protein NreA
MKPDKYFSKESAIKNRKLIESKIDGTSPPAIFIGSKLEYPAVNVGVLSTDTPKTNSWVYNAPNHWSARGVGIEKIIELRKQLINSRIRTKVEAARGEENKIIRQIQEIGMASVQAEVEIGIRKKPTGKMTYDKEVLPMAKNATMANIKIINNTKIPQAVERVFTDKQLPSREAISYLYNKGFEEGALSQVLSIGVTGRGIKRKFVPTRNSITAIDDTIAKKLLEKIRDYTTVDKPRMYFGGHLGNYYLIMIMPEIYSYELFETRINRGRITEEATDYEENRGRKEYANNTAGGYYAARLPIIQRLEREGKQAAIIALRFTTEEYHTPLGVWVCRNSVRKALEEEREYETKEEMIVQARKITKEKLGVDAQELLQKSITLKKLKEQGKLTKYFA